MVGGCNSLMGAAPLPLFCCPASENLEITIFRVVQKKIKQGYKGNLIQNFLFKFVEGGFRNINAQGHIIHLFANIFRVLPINVMRVVSMDPHQQ